MTEQDYICCYCMQQISIDNMEIEYQARKLQNNSQIIDGLIRDDRLKIVCAYYDISTGKVRFLT